VVSFVRSGIWPNWGQIPKLATKISLGAHPADQVTALYVDSDNTVMDTLHLDGKLRIYHPDADPPPAAGTATAGPHPENRHFN
jgi:hypothetical protein